MKKLLLASVLWGILVSCAHTQPCFSFRGQRYDCRSQRARYMPPWEAQVFPLLAQSKLSSFWLPAPSGETDAVFRRSGIFNRQFGLSLALPLISSSSSWRSLSHWFGVESQYFHYTYALSSKWNYAIRPDTDVSAAEPLPLLTSEGISLEMNSYRLGFVVRTFTEAGVWVSAQGGMAHHRLRLRTIPSIDYTPWEVDLHFRHAFRQSFHLQPYFGLSAGFGRRVYVSMGAQISRLGLRAGPDYALLYHTGSPNGVYLDLPNDFREDWSFQCQLGVGLRFGR